MKRAMIAMSCGVDGSVAADFNCLSIPEPVHPIRVTARMRYRQREIQATVWPLAGSRMRFVFDQAQRAITPGRPSCSTTAILFSVHRMMPIGGLSSGSLTSEAQ